MSLYIIHLTSDSVKTQFFLSSPSVSHLIELAGNNAPDKRLPAGAMAHILCELAEVARGRGALLGAQWVSEWRLVKTHRWSWPRAELSWRTTVIGRVALKDRRAGEVSAEKA